MLSTDFNDRLEKLKKRCGDKDFNFADYEEEMNKKEQEEEKFVPTEIRFDDKEIQVYLIDEIKTYNIYTNTIEKYRELPRYKKVCQNIDATTDVNDDYIKVTNK